MPGSRDVDPELIRRGTAASIFFRMRRFFRRSFAWGRRPAASFLIVEKVYQ
jgi:hypothetical protein